MTHREWRESHLSQEWREFVQHNRNDVAKLYRELRTHNPAMGRLLWKRLNAAHDKMLDLMLQNSTSGGLSELLK